MEAGGLFHLSSQSDWSQFFKAFKARSCGHWCTCPALTSGVSALAGASSVKSNLITK